MSDFGKVVADILPNSINSKLLGSYTQGFGFKPAKELLAARSATNDPTSQPLPGMGNGNTLDV